jgi:hypothetical protein
MSDPREATLAGDYATVSVTIGAAAQSLGALAASALATAGYPKTSEILQIIVLRAVAAGTARDAILFGGELSQLGYLAADSERVFPVRGSRVFVKRFGGTDVPAVLEIFLRKQ